MRRPPSSPPVILSSGTYAATCSTRSSPKRRRASSSSGPISGASSVPKRSRSSTTRRRASSSNAVSSGSDAARNRGRPCWRVPRISPSPRIERSTSASANPSPSPPIAPRPPFPPPRDRLEPRLRRIRLGVAEEDAEGLVAPTPDPAAELMELGEAEALRPLHQHHRGVGDVDADLDHGRGHQHVGLARDEGVHRPRLLLGGHLPVEEGDLEVAQRGLREAPRLGLGSLGLDRLRVTDEWADDERLAPLPQALADELVGCAPVLLVDHPGTDRL